MSCGAHSVRGLSSKHFFLLRGRRSAIAAVTLRGLGYKDVNDFGGISRWQGELER